MKSLKSDKNDMHLITCLMPVLTEYRVGQKK